MDTKSWLTSEETVRRSNKQYAHFDYRTDISQQRAYISNPAKVAVHAFYPFIHYVIKTVKFKKEKGKKTKERDICYAAHIDRCIYQYYSFILNCLYNARVREEGLSSVAVAYRTDLHESNINFAKRAFDFIREKESCYVMIGDFTGFFDNLDHQYLKKQWCSLLQEETLPPDHYAVFKSVTRYSKWELSDLLKLNDLEDTWDGRKTLNRKVRVLTKEQYYQHRSQIIKNKDAFGIPQGSPISATLANVYMLDVDKAVNKLVVESGGLYMRYSDDFIVALPNTAGINAKDILEQINILIKQAPRLTLERNKTQYFRYEDGRLENCSTEFHAEADASNSIIHFLGFSFDGQKVSIRPKTISKYYYRMNRKAKTVARLGGYTPEGKHISCKNLYARYSERGAKGKSGNFLTYVARAEKVFGSDEAIQRDTRNHMQKIRKALRKEK